MTDMFDMSGAYGRETGNALRRVSRNRARNTMGLLNNVARMGGSADQLLSAQRGLDENFLNAQGDVLSTMGLQHANALFGATENRNAMEFGAKNQREMQDATFDFNRDMLARKQAYEERQNELNREIENRRLWVNAGANIIGGGLGLALGRPRIGG